LCEIFALQRESRARFEFLPASQSGPVSEAVVTEPLNRGLLSGTWPQRNRTDTRYEFAEGVPLGRFRERVSGIAQGMEFLGHG
jgi:hypothetical protein